MSRRGRWRDAGTVPLSAPARFPPAHCTLCGAYGEPGFGGTIAKPDGDSRRFFACPSCVERYGGDAQALGEACIAGWQEWLEK